MFTVNWRICAVSVLACSLIEPAFANDTIGTAGPIRSFGGAHCTKNFSKGECDPPEVSSGMPLNERTSARVERARALLGVFRIAQAVAELDTALSEDPQAGSARLLRARLTMHEQPARSLQDVEALIRNEPANADALATRAFMLSGQQDDLALKDATRAVTLKPDNVDALCIRARIMNRLGKPDEAEQDFTRALAVEPDNSAARLARAELLMARGQLSEAERDASAAIAAGNDLKAWQLRAVARAKAGKVDEALSDFNVLLGPVGTKVTVGSNAPQFVDLLVQRALILSRTGRPDDAKVDLSSVAALGGPRAILQMQLYLRGHGFRDVVLDGKTTSGLDDDLISCFLNDACGRGLSLKT